MKIKVYFFDDLTAFSHEGFLHLLPPERRDRAEAFRNLIDRKLCVAAFLLLRLALRDYSFFTMPVLDKGERGKPILLEPQGLHFNLSHCNLGAVCALGERPLGVDIQDVRPISQSLINKTMNEQERDFINSSSNKDAAFARLWSRKESILKQGGEGISRPLSLVDSLDLPDTDTYEGKGFFISLSGGRIQLVGVNIQDFELLLSGEM